MAPLSSVGINITNTKEVLSHCTTFLECFEAPRAIYWYCLINDCIKCVWATIASKLCFGCYDPLSALESGLDQIIVNQFVIINSISIEIHKSFETATRVFNIQCGANFNSRCDTWLPQTILWTINESFFIYGANFMCFLSTLTTRD